MALLFLDSFDHYADITEKWDARTGMVEPTIGNNVDQSTAEGRFTPGALRIRNNVFGQNGIVKNFVATEELIVGFAWQNRDSDANPGDFKIENTAGDLQGTFQINSATGVGTLTCEGATVSTATLIFTGGVWQHVEIRMKRSATVGELEIVRNGTQVALLTGADTLGNSTTGFESFEVFANAASQQHHYIDDMYIADTTGPAPQNTFIGDSRITVLRPKANGLDNNFTPVGSDTNFGAVDETLTDGDTSFVEAGQVGAKETYTNFDFDDLGVSPGTIYSAQVVNNVKKTDAGTLRYLDSMTIGGLQFDNGTDVTATSGDYRMSTYIRDTDPSDSGTWTEAKIAAVGSSLEITFREV